VVTFQFVQLSTVTTEGLDAFKARLDVALGSLVCWLATLHTAEGLKLDHHCGPFQPRPFYDSVIAKKHTDLHPLIRKKKISKNFKTKSRSNG